MGIQDNIFKKSKIKKVSLPDTIFYFGKEVFRESEIESVNIPKSLKIIPDRTFYGCKNLKDIEFHDNIINCSKNAFLNTAVTPPENILDQTDKYILNSSSAWLEEGDWQYEMSLDFTEGTYYLPRHRRTRKAHTAVEHC